jgi:hypothetical protein
MEDYLFHLSKKSRTMKKITVIAFFCLSLVFAANAQDKAIGLRLGAGTAQGGEISFQMNKGDANRLELDLGLISNNNYSGVTITGMYQWVWDLKELGDGFKWYAAPGVGLRLFNGLGLGIHGQVGIEYSFDEIPLQLSLDTRPGWYFGGVSGIDRGAALSVRYLF